jgi:hypothetical protein
MTSQTKVWQHRITWNLFPTHPPTPLLQAAWGEAGGGQQAAGPLGEASRRVGSGGWGPGRVEGGRGGGAAFLRACSQGAFFLRLIRPLNAYHFPDRYVEQVVQNLFGWQQTCCQRVNG